MQEFFFTILSMWVIWKLFDAFSSKGRTSNYQQTNNYYQQKKEEGSVRVEAKKESSSKIPPDEGEYVDYEEIK